MFTGSLPLLRNAIFRRDENVSRVTPLVLLLFNVQFLYRPLVPNTYPLAYHGVSTQRDV